MGKNFSSDADVFFEDPGAKLTTPDSYGVLYLLRRDILICAGWDMERSVHTEHKALWPAAMALLAGIDLLGKFYAGSDEYRGAGPRFKKFISKYFVGVSADDDEIIYQLRNALLHSFGLYSKTKTKEYRFDLSNQRLPLVQRFSDSKYVVDLASLHDLFEKAVVGYQDELNREVHLQEKFKTMFPYYGAIRIV